MEENSSSQMGRFCRQWLLEIRICCHDSDYLSDSGKVWYMAKLDFSDCLQKPIQDTQMKVWSWSEYLLRCVDLAS